MAWVEISSLVVAVVAIIGIIVTAQRYNADKRNRIYARLDATKESIVKSVKEDYSRKDICMLKHDQVDKRLEAIEKQTALLPDIAALVKTLVNGKKNLTRRTET